MSCQNCKYWDKLEPEYFEGKDIDSGGTCDHEKKPIYVFLTSFGCIDSGKDEIVFPPDFRCNNYEQEETTKTNCENGFGCGCDVCRDEAIKKLHL